MAFYSLELLLLSFLVKDVSGSISLSTESVMVAVGSRVTLTCNNSLTTSSIFYFNTSVKLCDCKNFTSTCPVTDSNLYESSFNRGTGFNTYTCTVKNFTKEYCGSFSCNETTISDTININYVANFGEPCGTCGVCSGGQICSSNSKCGCPSGQTNQNGTCAPIPDKNCTCDTWYGNVTVALIIVDSAEVIIVGVIYFCVTCNTLVPQSVMWIVTIAMYLNIVWSVTWDFLLIECTESGAWCIALVNITLCRSVVSAAVKIVVMTFYSVRRPGKLLRKLTFFGKMEKEELIDVAFVLFVIDYIPWTFGLILLAPYCCQKGQLSKTVKSFYANDPKEPPHGQRTGHSDVQRGRAAESTRPKDKHQTALSDMSSRNVHEQPRSQPPRPLPGIRKSDNEIAEPYHTNTRGLSINYNDQNMMPQIDVRKSSLAPISTGFQEESDRKKKKKKKKKTEGNDTGRFEED